MKSKSQQLKNTNMQRTIQNSVVNKITAVVKMYPNQDLKIRIEDDYLKISWKSPMPTQVEASKGRKIQRKLDQVRQILGELFIEFDWLNDRQIVFIRS